MTGRHFLAACAVVLLVLGLGGSARSQGAAAAPAELLSQEGDAGTWASSAALPQSPPPFWDIETVDGGGGVPAASARSHQGVPYAVVAPGEIPWQVQVVDSTWGEATSLALDAAGYPHISYDAGGSLRYAYYDGTAWVTQSVDTAAFTGYVTSLALDSLGMPHISYCQGDGYMPRRCHSLRHAYYDGTQWHIEIVDGTDWAGTYSSLALDSADRPYISYQDQFNKVLKYARYDGATWQIETVDSSGWVGEGTSLALDAAGQPHISYGLLDDGTNTYYLKYTRYDGTAWLSQIVDSGGGQFSSLELDSLGQPHISYYGANNHLNYTWYDGSTWQIQVVDSSGDVGWGTSLALDAAAWPRITYWDRGNGDLKYAWYEGTTWQSQIVDGVGWVGQDSSLALDAAGRPHVSYVASAGGVIGLTYAEAQDSCLPVGAEMGWTPVSPTINLPVFFTNTLSGSYPISLTWNFGDGGGSSDPNPSHSYSYTGTYIVQLTVTNPCSQQSLQRALKVGCIPPWRAYFFLSPPTPTVGLPAQFTASTLGSEPMTYAWAFGDGSYDTGESVVHTYASTGTFTVQMTATNPCGGHTVSNTVNVVPTYPTGAGFSWQPLTPTARVALQFMGRADGAAPIEFTWDFGDGHSGSGPAPFHTYLVSGTFTVTMNAANAYGQQAIQRGVTIGPGSTWSFLTVGSEDGARRSLALDAAGRPHFAYYDGGLKYAYLDGNSWAIETVDNRAGTYVSLALDADGHPHIVYYDDSQTIKWASFDGASWNIQVVTAVVLEGNLSMALDSAGRPHISYTTGYCEGGPCPGVPYNCYYPLNYAYYDGTSWHFAVWAGPQGRGNRPPASVEGWPCPGIRSSYFDSSISLDSNDQPHISYGHYYIGTYGYPQYTHLLYDHETVDGADTVGYFTSLALDSADLPLISYYDAAAHDLKYARYDGSAWQIQVVDSAGDVGRYTSIAADAAGHPHIAYYDDSGYYLKYTHLDGASWHIEQVDDAAPYSPQCSLHVDAAGRPHIAYYGFSEDGYLKYAYIGECTPLADVAAEGPVTLPAGIIGAYSAAYTPTNPTPPIAFRWDNGATGPTAAYSWTLTGTHSVTVSVSNACSQVVTSLPVSVFCQAPLSVTVRGPHTLVPYLQGTYWASVEPITASRPLTFTWDNGDTGPRATYSWPATGTYTLTVLVENGCGQASNLFSVRVLAEWPWHFYLPLVLHAYTPPPCVAPKEASFTWEPLSPTVGTAVQFAASASGSTPLYFRWDWGDGGSGSGASAAHAYALSGTYTVTLTASNSCGSDVASTTLTVTCTPVHDAAFSWLPLTPTAGLPITFTAAASGTLPITFTWDFGDGTFATGGSPFPPREGGWGGRSITHTYAASGTYTVTLTTSNACGQEVVSGSIVVGEKDAVWSVAQERLWPSGVLDWRHKGALVY